MFKKTAAALLALIMLLSFFACDTPGANGGEDSIPSQSPTLLPSAADTAQPTPTDSAADLEKEHDFSVLALKEHGVPVRNLHVRADPHGLAPAVLAAHARQYVDVVRALLGAGKPCGNDSAVGKRQDS